MVQSKHSINKAFLVNNLAYRIGLYHPSAEIQIGTGNPEATILVVQSQCKMPERDAITGALKRFGILNEAYRATTQIVQSHPNIEYPDLVKQNRRGGQPKTQDELNFYYLKELINLIQPLVIVACGPDVMGVLRSKKVRSFKSYSGKVFRANNLTKSTLCATLDPATYGFARAPLALKEQGKREWGRIVQILNDEKEKYYND